MKTLLFILLLAITGCTNEPEMKKEPESGVAIGMYSIKNIQQSKSSSSQQTHVVPIESLSQKDQLRIYVDKVKKRGIPIKVIETPDKRDYWRLWFPMKGFVICKDKSLYEEPFGEAKIYCNWDTDFVIRYFKYVIYYHDKHQEYLNFMKCNPALDILKDTP